MDGFEWNKVFGAGLGVAFVVFGLSLAGEALYHPDENDPSTVLDLPEAVVAASGGAEPKGAEPILALLASADLAAGENTAKKCVACHVFEKGGQNKVGPHNWGVVGREIAAVSDFGYSAALKAYAEGGKQWTYEELNGFLWKPKVHVKGTSMGFAGLRSPEERANIIAWMNTKSDSPLPPPTPEQIAAEAGPAEGEAAPPEGAAVPAAAEGEGATTPAANQTGDPNAEGAIVVDPNVPGAVVAPAGQNALGDDAAPAEGQPDGAATVGDAPVPTTAAPETIAPKSEADGASLPLAPDAANPRAGAQSDSTGQQGLAPSQVEQMNEGAAAPAATPAAPATAPAAPAAPAAAPAGQTDGTAATVGDAPVPTTAAPETIAPKSQADGASLPLAPDAANPRAGAQSDSTGQQGLAPAQVEQLNEGAAATPAAPAATPAAPAANAPATNAPAPNSPAPNAPANNTTGDTGTQTYTVPVKPAD